MTTFRPIDSRYDTMPYGRCGRSGLLLPAISLGLWRNFGGVDPFENGRAMVLRAFDLGITHFDLANNYGPPPGSAEDSSDSRAGKTHGFLRPAQVDSVTVAKARHLQDHARARGQTLAQMAIAWVLRHPQVTSALIGASRVGQVEDAVASLGNRAFTRAELEGIDRILAG